VASLTIALTGGIGSGKSTLARLLVDQGAALIDTDAIAHELTAVGGCAIEAIRTEFGPDYVDRDGGLDRARMRALVFSEPQSRQRLQALLHPMIWRRAEQMAGARAGSAAYLVFDIPLLTAASVREHGLNRVLVVDCPVWLQVARVLRRGALNRSEVEAIVAAQAGRGQRLELADEVVFNAIDLPALEQRALRLHAFYRDLASRRRAV
jgi:dephospho-CoA kinase